MNFLNEFVSLCEFLENKFLKLVFLLLDVFSQQTFTNIWKPTSWKERKKNQHCFKGLLCCYAISFYYFHAIFVYLWFLSYIKEYKIVCVNEII